MAIITKIFVQEHISNDCEALHWKWIDTTKTYDELKDALTNKWNGWFDAVRVVEKTFDDETFTITEKVIKKAERTYKDFHWVKGTIEETIN